MLERNRLVTLTISVGNFEFLIKSFFISALNKIKYVSAGCKIIVKSAHLY